jgi:hypothetical protein
MQVLVRSLIGLSSESHESTKYPATYVLQYSEISLLFLFAVVVSADDHLFLAKNSCILYGEEN